VQGSEQPRVNAATGVASSGADPDPTVEAVDVPVITSIPARGTTREAVEEAIVAEALELHGRRLKAFAQHAVRDGDDADDLVQDTFLRLVAEVRAGRVPDNIGAWLFRVCGNLVVSRGRRRTIAQRMKALLVDRGTSSSAEEHAVRADENSRLKTALGELPPDARVALLMAAEGYGSAEIGETIGRTASATMTYVCRARIRLRELLAEPAEAAR
jgi:RNA polymerase sigma-70 factor (ECF subfamily)